MDFTFGIITGGNNDNSLHAIIQSIEQQNIEKNKYEIIIVGNSKISGKNNTRIIPFDENIKDKWITKKKNTITENSKFENIVYMHDYFIFTEGWYKGFLKYGENFLACMNKIVNADGSRFRDWTMFPLYDNVVEKGPMSGYLIPYNISTLSPYQYFSGGYFVCKKSIMKEMPLNENLCWGEGEDVEWSRRFNSAHTFNMNPFSIVKLLKYKPNPWWNKELSPEELKKFL